MDKRKQLLDSLDAAFASKKPKISHATNIVSKKAGPNEPKPAEKPSNKKSQVVQKNERKLEKPNPLYSRVPDECHVISAQLSSQDKLRPPLAVLEEQLEALALIKHRKVNDDSLVAKVKSKILQLENPHKAKPAHQSSSHNRLEFPHRMSMKTRRNQGFHSPAMTIDYADAEELHRIWIEYMTDLINTITQSSTTFTVCGPKLLKADYRGCHLRVVRSSNPCLLGSSGIVIEEQANTFHVVNVQGAIQNFPKAGSIFSFELGTETYRFRGDDFRSRRY
ncbi:unnamed protein product [Aphanomyces euteiches]|uniref:Uncharacterized protein n=1 Tax=Aphanomyces euteiches TaxID=100861 RepID=A0A6G0X4V3_9STRA|nr:hypothetical protein Ae201684_008452 [Aphanomyces euteiches]KAH9070326.1 hypothetical protein Ae201684P_002688 [Aphanomyces euteiches]KAH9141454.1 hypothetical protein AeRB84_014369 [Aphanomyces euteiches]